MTAPEDERRGVGLDAKAFGEPSEYSFIPRGEVAGALADVGISSELVMLDGIYVTPDAQRAVGVREVTEEDCRDHFVGNPILPGVHQAMMVHQTDLARRILTGEVDAASAPRLKALLNGSLSFPAIPGAKLNIFIDSTEDSSGRSITEGKIMSGRIPVAEMTTSVEDTRGYGYAEGGEVRSSDIVVADERQARQMLERWHYGPSKQFVHGLGRVNDGEVASYLSVTPGMTEGYQIHGRNVLPEVYIMEAVAQGLLINAQAQGMLDPERSAPRLTGIKDFHFYPEGIVAPSNLTIDLQPEAGDGLGGEGMVRVGEWYVASGTIRGTILDADKAASDLVRAAGIIRGAKPKFPTSQAAA